MATKTRTKTTTKVAPKISLKLTKENPFYGKRSMLDMFQQMSKMSDGASKDQVYRLLDAAWRESKDRASRELFFVMIFAFGDVANRDHNALVRHFGKNDKFDKGGNSLRKVFIHCMQWMIEKDADQFYTFLPIIAEYTNIENSFFYQLRTDRKTGKVLEVLSIVPTDAVKRAEFIDKVTDHLVNIIRNVKTTDAQHTLLAKFLPKPRFSKRTRLVVNRKSKETTRKKSPLQAVTKKKEMFEAELITKLSEKLGWEMIKYKHNMRFVGLESYKAKHNRNSEAYLFSTKKILNMDSEQFKKWLDTLPSGARFRVQCRLFKKDDKNKKKLVSRGKWVGKYGDLAKFYDEWTSQKEKANTVVRELEVKAKTTGLTEKEQEKLVRATKDAKVNTGADTILDCMVQLFGKFSDAEFNAKVDNLLRKIDIKVPALIIADVSGSMSSTHVTYKGVTFSANDMARLATTIFMLKNPDPDMQQLLITFDDRATIIAAKEMVEARRGVNKYMSGNVTVVDKLVDPKDNFQKNYERISQYVFSRNSTNLSSVPTEMKRWVDAVPAESDMRKEMINQYPVWVVVSDGDINNMPNATASVQDFMMKMKQWFGWNGVLVIWDVRNPFNGDEKNKYENVENVIYYGSCNPQALHQIFANIDDLDVVDIYQTLLSMYRSNRYELVKELVK